MFKILKGDDDLQTGVIVIQESKNASSLPFVIHFLAQAVEANKKVTILSSKLSEMNFRLICSKAGVRWNPQQISLISVCDPFEDFDLDIKSRIFQLKEKTLSFSPELVIIDDLSALEHLGAKSYQIVELVHYLYSEMKNFCGTPLVVGSFSMSSKSCEMLKNRCNSVIDLTPVGHGFSKDANSKAIITSRHFNAPTSRKGIIISGERTNNATWISLVS